MIDKDGIRKEIIRRLREQDASLRNERSFKIQEKLLSSEEFKVSETVMTYVSMPTEVNTSYFNEEALKRGKRLFVPFVEQEKAVFGIEYLLEKSEFCTEAEEMGFSFLVFKFGARKCYL